MVLPGRATRSVLFFVSDGARRSVCTREDEDMSSVPPPATGRRDRELFKQGLYYLDQRAILLANTPANLNAFITRIRDLEVIGGIVSGVTD